jgi:hypothetical protein
VANNPYVTGTNILSVNTNPYFQGPTADQISAHIGALIYLNTLIDLIVANQVINPMDLYQNTVPQAPIQPLVTGGDNAIPFIDLEFTTIENIVGAANLAAAEAVIPPNLITKTGTISTGAGSAIALITTNIDFLIAEVVAYVNSVYSSVYNNSTMTDGQMQKCARDVGVIIQRLLYDLDTGGNYNAVYSGLSYWSRNGTHHIVSLGENVTRTDLFPDGATVNFYQRSYISASGYVFEYVGAGTNYGALPQVGRADPVQGKETVQLDSGKVFFTSTDQNGDFRIGPGLVISQATGVLSGRTFSKSLFANMTPFILAIEGL